MDRQRALILIREHVKTKNLIKHLIATEAVMKSLANHFSEDVQIWGLAGLLHDIDYDLTKDNFSQHGKLGSQILANEKVDGKVIPLTLQALVENAIKHNEISKANPLKIVIAISDDYELIVENNLQPKELLEETSKTGLNNLAGRYEFLTGKEMIITRSDNYFRVSLPLIRLEN